MGQGLSNAQKAEVFELTVSVNNNLSLCFMKLKLYAESSSYAINSVRLIEALEARAGESSLVFEALVQRGVIKDVAHMNKLWKRKALYCAGKAEYLRKNCDEATQLLQMAVQIIGGDPNFKKDEEDIKTLLISAKKLKKEVLQREKNMYSKAMKKANSEDSKVEAANNAENSSTSDSSSNGENTNSNRQKSSVGGGGKVKTVIDVKGTVKEEEDDVDGDEEDENEDMWTIGLAVGAIAALGIAFFVWQRARKY